MFIAPTLAVTNTLDYKPQQRQPLDKANWFWSDVDASTSAASDGYSTTKKTVVAATSTITMQNYCLNRNRKVHDANADIPQSSATETVAAAKESVKKRLMAKLFQTLKELVVTNGANSPLASAARRQRQQRNRRRQRAASLRRHMPVTQLSSLSSGGSYFEPLLETIVEESDAEVLTSTSQL